MKNSVGTAWLNFKIQILELQLFFNACRDISTFKFQSLNDFLFQLLHYFSFDNICILAKRFHYYPPTCEVFFFCLLHYILMCIYIFSFLAISTLQFSGLSYYFVETLSCSIFFSFHLRFPESLKQANLEFCHSNGQK